MVWRQASLAAVVVVATSTGCTVVAGAFAHHNSRGTACQNMYLPPAIDAIAGGVWAVGLALAEEDAGWGWAGPAALLGTAVVGTILVERCRGGSSSRSERARERLRYRDDASVSTPQPIRGQPETRPARRPLPEAPVPAAEDDGDRPASLRLPTDFVVKDPDAVEREELEKARRGELRCGQETHYSCPAGYTCAGRGTAPSLCVPRQPEGSR